MVVGAGGGRGMVTFAGVEGLVDDILVRDLLVAAREELPKKLKYCHVSKQARRRYANTGSDV